MQAIIHLCFSTVVIDLLCTFTTANCHTCRPYLLAFCIFCSYTWFYTFMQIYCCTSHLRFNVFCTFGSYTCTVHLCTCMLCPVVTITVLFPPCLMQAVSTLVLCLFSHTSYFSLIIRTDLEKSRYNLKCCDVIHFGFSLAISKPVY